MNVEIENDYKNQGGITMSTTSKIKNALVQMLNEEENKAGLTVSEVWNKLEQTEFKAELFNKAGERRNGTLVGLTTRIKEGKVEGIKVVKNSANNLVYVASSNQVEYLVNLTSKYIEETTKSKIKKESLDTNQQTVVKNFEEELIKLHQLSEKLKKVSDEVEKAKLEQKVEPTPEVKKPVEKVKEKASAEKTKKGKPEVKTTQKTTDTAKK